MRINHNIASLNTYRQLTGNTTATSKSLEKLSSGLRINRAGDDAAGLAISEKMRGQIRGLDQASSNAQDGISLLQTAEGALNETHSILQRMRELAVQSATDTNTASDRAEIQKEVDQLATEVTRIANDTEFNTQKLLNGGVSTGGLGESTFHIGANAGQSLNISIGAMDAKTLGVARDVNAATGTAVSDVGSATFDNTNLGSKIVNAAVITFNYAPAVGSTPADSASLTAGANAAATTVLTGVSADATLTINLDGTSFVLSKAEMTACTGALKTNDDLINAIQTKIGGAGTVGVNGGKLVISSNTTGTSSTATVTIAGTTVTGIDTAFGFTSGANDIGTAAIAAVPAKITLSDGTNSQDVSISDTAANTLSVTSGIFSGMTINTAATKKLSDLDSTNDKVTVAIKATVATAASFSGGAKTADAVASAGIDVSTKDAANTAITSIEAAVTTVSAERSKLGAVQNRLEHTINNLSTSSENLTASESRIRDVDMAKEMMSYTKNNILTQAATAMLAQANQQPQGVLQLLQ